MVELLKMKVNRRRNLSQPYFCRRHFYLSTKDGFTKNLDPRRSDRYPLQRSITHHGRHLSNTPHPLARPLPTFNDEPSSHPRHAHETSETASDIPAKPKSTAELA